MKREQSTAGDFPIFMGQARRVGGTQYLPYPSPTTDELRIRADIELLGRRLDGIESLLRELLAKRS